jgi:hypothetical protein
MFLTRDRSGVLAVRTPLPVYAVTPRTNPAKVTPANDNLYRHFNFGVGRSAEFCPAHLRAKHFGFNTSFVARWLARLQKQSALPYGDKARKSSGCERAPRGAVSLAVQSVHIKMLWQTTKDCKCEGFRKTLAPRRYFLRHVITNSGNAEVRPDLRRRDDARGVIPYARPCLAEEPRHPARANLGTHMKGTDKGQGH